MQITCISWKFSINKTEAISANCDFIVFTAELLQYSTESHEIKLLWKTRQKKSRNCCMAATASSLPRAVQRPLANYSSISWFLVAYRSKAKNNLVLQITQNIQQTAGRTRGWRCLRRVFCHRMLLLCLASWQKMWCQCPFLVSVLSTILGLFLITKRPYHLTVNVEDFVKSG